MTLEDTKRAAAAQALTLVQDGMKLGLGTGSTARHFVDLLGEKVRGGLRVICVPTSGATRIQALALNIPLADISDLVSLDLTVDGADEIDPGLNLVKGGGAAHLHEKIVAAASRQMIVIADETKLVKALGKFPLPVEIIRFGEGATAVAILAAFTAEGLDAHLEPRMRADGSRLVTDEGNFILDCRLKGGDGNDPGHLITNPAQLAVRLAAIPGVVEHGLFVGLCTAAYIASDTGVVRIDRKP